LAHAAGKNNIFIASPPFRTIIGSAAPAGKLRSLSPDVSPGRGPDVQIAPLAEKVKVMNWQNTSSKHGRSGEISGLRSRLAHLERVALAQVAGIEAGLEPAHPLLRRPMRERLGNHVALRTLLNLIVSDRCGAVQTFLRVARIEKVALLREESP